MPIDFPNSPSTNDEFTSGSTTWRWDGSVWKVVRDFAPTGATGAVGPTGAVGQTGATGITGINWTADFDFIGYSVGDVVQYSGSAYYCNTAIAIGDIMSHIPGSSARWDLLAAKGAVGATGVDGPTGPAGSAAELVDVESIQFDTTASPTILDGTLGWNAADGTLKLGLSDTKQIAIGEEQVYTVRNATGGTLNKGVAVYASGVESSGRISVSPYIADGSIREVRFMGIVAENISNGVNGFVQEFGYITGLDTRGTASTAFSVGNETWAAGDILYVHPTVAGKLTNVKPQHEVVVAIIIIRHQNTGVIFVRPSSGGHIEDIHDINITGVTGGDVLAYNSSTQLWENSSDYATLVSGVVPDEQLPDDIVRTDGLTGALGDYIPSSEKGSTGGVAELDITGKVPADQLPPDFDVSATTPPASPQEGDAWYDSASGNLYVYYDSYWVEAASANDGPTGNTGATGPTGPQGTSINVIGTVADTGSLPPTGATNDAYIVTADGDLYIWDGAAWTSVGQIVGPVGPTGSQGVTGATGPEGEATLTRFRYTAVGGETGVSGADDNAVTLTYVAGKEQVHLNGVLLVRGQDYTATNGTSITALTALEANDVVEIITFGSFNVANVIEPSIIDAKGDLLVGTAADTVGRVAVGTNGQYLQADSSATAGVKWATVAGYSAPTLGSTSIASGATVTTVVGLTKIRSDQFTTLDADGYEIDLELMTIMGAF
jgi:collagen type VII alpha